MSSMSKRKLNILPGARGRVPYLLRLAFAAAAAGNADNAEYLWEMAISEGYRPKPKTRRNLTDVILENAPGGE